MKYVSYKNRKEFMREMKKVYQTNTEKIALEQLDDLKEKW